MRITMLLGLCWAIGTGQVTTAEEIRFETAEEQLALRETNTLWPMNGGTTSAGYDFTFKVESPHIGRGGQGYQGPFYESRFPYKGGYRLPEAFLDREHWPFVVTLNTGAIWDYTVLEAGNHRWYDHLVVHLRTANGAQRLLNLPVVLSSPVHEQLAYSQTTYSDYSFRGTNMPLARRGRVTVSVPAETVRAAWGADFSGHAILEFWIDTRGAADLTPAFFLATFPLQITPAPSEGDDLANHLFQDARIASILGKNHTAALAITDRLLELKPESIFVRMLRADILEDAGRLEEAVTLHSETGEILEKQLKGEWGDPDHVDPKRHQAWIDEFGPWPPEHWPPRPNWPGEWPEDKIVRAGYNPYRPYDPGAEAARIGREIERLRAAAKEGQNR